MASAVPADAAQPAPKAPAAVGRRTALGLIVAALLAVGSGLVAVWSARQAIALDQQVRHALQLMLGLDGVQVHTLNLQTGSRGYLLSGDEDFLGRLNTGKERLRDSLDDVKALAAHIPAQKERLQRLELLVLRAMELFETRVRVRREQGLDAALAAVPLAEGRAVVDDITALISEMTLEENLLLNERSDRMERRSAIALGAIIGCLAFATALVGLSFWSMRNAHSRRLDAELRLRAFDHEREQAAAMRRHAKARHESDERHRRVLEGQNRILEMIASDVATPEILAGLVRWIESQAPGMLGSILLLDEDGIHVRHGAAPSLPEEFVRAIDGQPIGPKAGSCGTAAHRGEPVFVEDIATDPLWEDYRAATLPHGLRACWSTPIFDAQQRVLGTFAMYYRKPRLPGAEEQRLIDIATHLASVCLSRHREQRMLRENERRLAASEARLRLALEASRTGIFDWDMMTGLIAWSRSHEELWGFKPGEFGGTYESFASRVHPDDLPGLDAEVERCVRDREPFEREFRVVWPDGSVRWVNGRGEFVFAPDGKPVRMRGAVVDFTRRKEAEAALSAAHDRLAALSRRLLDIQESERRQLARELHDEIGQALTAVKINLQSLQGFPDPAAVPLQLADSVAIVERALQQTRTLSLDLRPPLLDDLGLLPALRWLADQQARRTGVEIRVLGALDERPAPEIETACFRLAQEALTNALRHAAPSAVRMALEIEDDRLQVEVRDDGRGFDPAAARSRALQGVSMGLLGMEERAALVGGRIEWLTAPGAGTTVRFRLPWKPLVTVSQS